jgi:hypothetical protein
LKNNTPVESIGTWASHADEDVLRPAPNQEGVELGRNDLAAMHLNETVSMKVIDSKGQFLDLKNPVHAYLYGLIQTDGHLSKDTRNRGKLRIEISYTDADVLEKLANIIPYHAKISIRTRSTNYSLEHKSAILSVYAKEFRDELVRLGVNVGEKSKTVDVPSNKFSKADYFRGIIDGDGSLGFTSNHFPFLSLCTASEKLAVAYEAFVREKTGKAKRLIRNSRDKVFNITVYKEDAQAITAILYYEGCVCISRKQQVASTIQIWKRPQGMRRIPHKKFWTEEQDNFILSHTINESAAAKKCSKHQDEIMAAV